MAILKTDNNASDALPANTKLQGGAFAIGKVLGQGGFGITYYGGDMTLHRYVAIKEFFPAGCVRQGNVVQPDATMSLADFENAKRKFLEEARALARFQHRNIARVLTIFQDNNTAYMVMEFLKGKTLMQLSEERGAMPEREALGHIEQICEALTAVHGANLIHRDVKPENVMVCDDGRTVLIDFGLNKKLEQSGGHATRRFTGTSRFGSENYAPPEQHLTHAPVGAFSDIYALGATLYHLLTGKAPVPAPERAMGTDLMPPDRVNPNVSPTMSRAVMQAMELKGDQRLQNVQAFLGLLKGTAAPAPHTIPASLHPTTVQAYSVSTPLQPTVVLPSHTASPPPQHGGQAPQPQWQPNTNTQSTDKPVSTGLLLLYGLLSFCVPLAGILFYFGLRNKSVNQARGVATCAICGLVIGCSMLSGDSTSNSPSPTTQSQAQRQAQLQAPLVQSPFVSSAGYQMTPPLNWQVDTSGRGVNADVFFIGPSADNSPPSINVIVLAATPGETLQSAQTQINDLMPRIMTDYKLVDQGYTTLGGVQAFYNTSTSTSGTPAQVSRLHQVVALKNNRAYTFTCGSLDSDFANYDGAFKAALDSVRWTQ